MNWYEKRVKELDYKGCRNCKHQIEPLRGCEWIEKGGDGRLHLICPKWEKKKRGSNRMIVLDDYSIEELISKNQIIINLPQTQSTLTNTVTPIVERRTRLTDQELTAILVAVKAMYEVGNYYDERTN